MKYLSNYIEKEQSKMFEDLGIFFAFSDKQFDENKVDGIEYVSMGAGMICPKANVKKYIEQSSKIYEKGIKQDLKENGKSGVIQRELGNHEFIVTYCIDDTMNALQGYGITEQEVRAEVPKYLEAYRKWQEKEAS